MNGLCEYQIRILKQDMGKMFVPMYFYHQETGGIVETNIKYDLTGHISMKEWLIRGCYNSFDLLDVLENVVLLLDKCKEVLINYENLRIELGTLYISTLNVKEIKLQYIPKDEVEESFCFYNLLKEIEVHLPESNSKDYILILMDKLDQERPGLQKTITIIGRLKREIYSCGWIGNNQLVNRA